ncbi:hypothetical protein EON81_00285 [bacterium]|nr:MAG: hypothetical protein EON81_00285 [bacterium]
MRGVALLTLSLLPLGAFAQGVSDSNSIGFEITRAKVTDVVRNFLLSFGQTDAPELVQTAKRESPNGKFTLYDVGPYRLTVRKGLGEVVLIRNVSMLETGAPSPTAKPRFANLEAAKKHVRDYVGREAGGWVAEDPEEMNGLYVIQERTVSGVEATRNRRNGGRPYHLFLYGLRRAGYNFPIDPVYIEVVLDAEKGDLLSYLREPQFEQTASLNGENVSEAAALAVANKAVAGVPTHKGLGWVFSNQAWQAPAPGEEARLAWIFTFGKKQVWVDARTTKVIGGVP